MRIALAAAVLAFTVASATDAQTIAWTDWQSAGPDVVNGVIDAPGGAINVTFSGVYLGAQTNGGVDYWAPGTYNGSYNKPVPASDIVRLSQGGTRTISFDVPVTDPYLALMSWNNNVADFGTLIEVVAVGSGYWGSGNFVLNSDSTGFTGVGEVHGIIRLPGTFTSITFTHTSENWHGFTLGVLDVASGVVPEPATWAMLIAGFGLVGVAARRRRIAAAHA